MASGSQCINLPSVCVKTANLRYLDEFLKVKCGPDLVSLGVFPNSKEITESFAAYNAVRKAMASKLSDPSGLCIVIGDGNTPRTGVVFAYRSRWTVWSVDPRMKMGALRTSSFNPAVERLYRRATKIEEAWERLREEVEAASFVVIVAVHSHAKLDIPIWVDPEMIVAMPCCVKQTLDKEWSYQYDDWGVHSPMRKIYVWRKRHGDVGDPEQRSDTGRAGSLPREGRPEGEGSCCLSEAQP